MNNIFQSIDIKKMTCKNRILRSATWENMCDDEGYMSEELFTLYDDLAKGQVGLICTGYARVMENEFPNSRMMGIYSDKFIPQYERLTKSVHEYGSKIIMMIAYGGTKTTYKVGEREIFAPSDLPEKGTGVVGKPMTKEDIQVYIEAMADAAERVKKSGFDGVQIQLCHSYLLNQFMSSYNNNRTDEYGGSFENRMRLIFEVLDAIREKVGEDFPVLAKVTCSDFYEGGFTFEESKKLCRLLEQWGIAMIEITGNIHGKAEKMVGQEFDGIKLEAHGFFRTYAEQIADELSIPVYVTGGFRDPKEMNHWMEESKLSGYGLCRPLLSEPDLVKRWQDGDVRLARCKFCSLCRTKPEKNYCVYYESVKE